MVKTCHGRKPGAKHAKIVKKLRHRRRMAAAHAARMVDLVDTTSSSPLPSTSSTWSTTSVSAPSEVACEILNRDPELPHNRLYFTFSEVNTLSDALSSGAKESVAVNADDKDKQLVLYYGKSLNRGVSEACDGLKNAVEEDFDDASTACSGYFEEEEKVENDHQQIHVDEENRLQHPDEETDRYLSHLFTPSICNVTTALDEYTQNDTHTDETHFQRLRNLFSSDSQHTKHGLTNGISETTLGLNTLFNNCTLRNHSSHETSMGLRTLFDEKTATANHEHYKPGLPTIMSETNCGVTWFDTDTTSANKSSRIRTLSENATSSFGLLTLFNDRQVQSTASTLGIRSLFQEKDETPKSYTCNCKSVGEMPSMTNFSSTSLLGNLFGSEHNIHGSDEVLTAKERKKVMIAKDLAQYLNSDDERTHQKSATLSTFVQQIESLFEKYRVAIAEVENLKNQIAGFQKNQE